VKPKKCKYCKASFVPTKPLQQVCGLTCAINLSKVNTAKESDRKWKKQKQEIKNKLKTISDYRKDARFWFQRWIRIRDLGKTCISCPTLLTDIRDYDAGHYFSAYAYPQTIFNEMNVHGQCVGCNDHRSGNLIEYRKGLVNRYGMNILLDLEEAADDKSVRVLTKEYYIEIAEEYKARCKNLENKKSEAEQILII